MPRPATPAVPLPRPSRLLPALLALVLVLAPPATAQSGAQVGGLSPTAAPVDLEALLLEVAARFDPAFDGDRAAHAHPAEQCLTPLLLKVRAAAPWLSPAQRDQLASLSPVLDSVLVAAAPGLAEAGSSLLDNPDLTETVEGKECVVHYTLSGPHAAPDEAFVKLLAKLVDQAVKKYAKDYPRPFFETDRDDVDVLHVFIIDTSTVPEFDEAVLGYVNPTEDVPGEGNEKANTTYMVIDRQLKTVAENAGKNWKRLLKSTVFHEYYHCIQLAKNWVLASWGLEGQAVWAEARYARILDDVYGWLELPTSMVNAPELPLWDDTIRKYSTAPLWFYVEQRLGKDALRRFWDLAASSNDPINVLKDLLLDEDFLFFEDFWLDFAGRLVAEDIKGLNAKKMPDLKRQEETDTYGWTADGMVQRTGIRAYDLLPPDGKGAELLFARVDDTDGGLGQPEGIVIHDKNKRLELGKDSWNSFGKFKKPATLVVTDGHYSFPDVAQFSFTARAFAPSLKVTDVDWGSPVPFGDDAMVTFTYDLLGVPAGATFDVAIFRRIKGKKLDVQTQVTEAWPVGLGQTKVVQFGLNFFPPQKKVSVQMNVKVPPDFPYGGEHVVSKNKGSIKIAGP